MIDPIYHTKLSEFIQLNVSSSFDSHRLYFTFLFTVLFIFTQLCQHIATIGPIRHSPLYHKYFYPTRKSIFVKSQKILPLILHKNHSKKEFTYHQICYKWKIKRGSKLSSKAETHLRKIIDTENIKRVRLDLCMLALMKQSCFEYKNKLPARRQLDLKTIPRIFANSQQVYQSKKVNGSRRFTFQRVKIIWGSSKNQNWWLEKGIPISI